MNNENIKKIIAISVSGFRNARPYVIEPQGKPRTTHRAKHINRAWQKYTAWKDKARCLRLHYLVGEDLLFIFKMPPSWTKAKKEKMLYTPHCQVPDIDNLIKAILDLCYKDDKVVWSIGKVKKIWGQENQIIIGKDMFL